MEVIASGSAGSADMMEQVAFFAAFFAACFSWALRMWVRREEALPGIVVMLLVSALVSVLVVCSSSAGWRGRL